MSANFSAALYFNFIIFFLNFGFYSIVFYISLTIACVSFIDFLPNNFLNVADGTKTGSMRLLRLYMSQWEKMSSMLWPESERVTVVHLGVQGANDCGIWTWLL